ncbi:MSH5 protein, partial [Polypterus senegalus]
MMGLSDFLTDVAKKELDDLDSQIPSCSVIYIPLIGFLLSIPRLPNMLDRSDFEINGLEFMFLSENRLHYRSSRTKELDNLLGDLHCDINDMETAVITQLQGKILEKALVLNDVMEYSAQLDCLISLSEAAREFSYVKPTVSVQGVFRILQSRIGCLSSQRIVDQLGFLPSHFRPAGILGKLTLAAVVLGCVGLIIFMAHIGSNVPASEAEIGLVDGIYTCMQTKESVSVGLSSFMIELNQMASALNNSTDKSVILIDEFGTGTNTTMETTVDGDELVFFYQLKEGLSESSYAANIATIAGMPANIVERAVEYCGGECALCTVEENKVNIWTFTWCLESWTGVQGSESAPYRSQWRSRQDTLASFAEDLNQKFLWETNPEKTAESGITTASPKPEKTESKMGKKKGKQSDNASGSAEGAMADAGRS